MTMPELGALERWSLSFCAVWVWWDFYSKRKIQNGEDGKGRGHGGRQALADT